MFSFFKKKVVVPHIRLAGVIGSAGRFRQGIDFSGQQEIIKKAFSFKKAKMWRYQLILQAVLPFNLI